MNYYAFIGYDFHLGRVTIKAPCCKYDLVGSSPGARCQYKVTLSQRTLGSFHKDVPIVLSGNSKGRVIEVLVSDTHINVARVIITLGSIGNNIRRRVYPITHVMDCNLGIIVSINMEMGHKISVPSNGSECSTGTRIWLISSRETVR